MTAAMLAAIVRTTRHPLVLGVAVFALLGTAAPHAAAADAPGAAKKTASAKKAAARTKAAAQPAVPARAAVKELVEGEDVRGFRAFCDQWMQKLRDRNAYNDAHITWTAGGPGVVGEYVNYGTERTCIAREEPGKDPIGKITYREIKYRREGANEAAARVAAGTIVEQTDVTEIFRYAKGAWQY
jgi:hypothetical protein